MVEGEQDSPPVRLIAPPGGVDSALPAEEVGRVIEGRRDARPSTEDPFFGRRSLASVVDLYGALSDHDTFGSFSSALLELPEAANSVDGAEKIARDAQVDSPVAAATALLLGERNTSCAKNSALGVALSFAAADLFGVPTFGLSESSPVAETAIRLAVEYAEPLQIFLQTQRRLTEELFAGVSGLSLFRMERWPEAAPADQVALQLRPLSSWTTERETAHGMAGAPDAQGGGRWIRVLAADIPTDRVLSTSVTGFGAPFESEVVVTGGWEGDRCTVIADAKEEA